MPFIFCFAAGAGIAILGCYCRVNNTFSCNIPSYLFFFHTLIQICISFTLIKCYLFHLIYYMAMHNIVFKLNQPVRNGNN